MTEGVDRCADLMLIRRGGLARTIDVTVTPVPGTAEGITCMMSYSGR